MRFVVLGGSVVLAMQLLAHALASAAVLLGWRVMRARAQRWTAARQVGLIGALRVLPTIAAGSALALLVPAWLTFEPRATRERVGLPLALLALAGAALLLGAVARGLRSYGRTAGATRAWARDARPLGLAAGMPAFAVRHPFPVVAVAGIWRPRLFVAEQVLADMSSQEMEAVLAHEAAHRASRDNLKALGLSFCPSWTGVGAWRRLERDWSDACEAAADEHVSMRGEPEALDLASALMKVARLARPAPALALPASALHEGGSVAWRVRRLLERGRVSPGSAVSARARAAHLALAVGGLAGLLALVRDTATLRAVHALSETLVRLAS